MRQPSPSNESLHPARLILLSLVSCAAIQLSIAWFLATWTMPGPLTRLIAVVSSKPTASAAGVRITEERVDLIPAESSTPGERLLNRTRPPIQRVRASYIFGLPWPWLSFDAETTLHGFGIDPSIWYTTRTGFAIFHRGTAEPVVGGYTTMQRALPLRIHLQPLVLNTALTACSLVTIWGVCCAAPLALRTRLRISRRCCPHCGYDVRHARSEVCPECGLDPLLLPVNKPTLARFLSVIAIASALVALIAFAYSYVQTRPWPSIVAAARDGDHALLRHLIAAGIPIDSSLDPGWSQVHGSSLAHFTALMAAARYGDPESLHILIDGGADTNACTGMAFSGRIRRSAGNYTALMFAIDARRLANAQCLLEHGADPNHVSTEGHTALTFAIGDGNWEAVELLLSNGAQLDAAGLDVLQGMLFYLIYARSDSDHARRMITMILATPMMQQLRGIPGTDWDAALDGMVRAGVEPVVIAEFRAWVDSVGQSHDGEK